MLNNPVLLSENKPISKQFNCIYKRTLIIPRIKKTNFRKSRIETKMIIWTDLFVSFHFASSANPNGFEIWSFKFYFFHLEENAIKNSLIFAFRKKMYFEVNLVCLTVTFSFTLVVYCFKSNFKLLLRVK